MKTDEIREAKQQHYIQHGKHIEENINSPRCIYCNKISKESSVEFQKFWDWLQTNYSALLITGISEKLFKEVITCRREINNNRSQEIEDKLEELLLYITFGVEEDIGKLVEETLNILDKRSNFRKTTSERLQEKILKELDHFGSDIGSEVESEISIEENKVQESEESEEQSEKSIESNKLFEELNIKPEEIWNQELETEMTKKNQEKNFSSTSYEQSHEDNNDEIQDEIKESEDKKMERMFKEGLANLGRMRETLNFTPDIFYERDEEDPVE